MDSADIVAFHHFERISCCYQNLDDERIWIERDRRVAHVCADFCWLDGLDAPITDDMDHPLAARRP